MLFFSIWAFSRFSKEISDLNGSLTLKRKLSNGQDDEEEEKQRADGGMTECCGTSRRMFIFSVHSFDVLFVG